MKITNQLRWHLPRIYDWYCARFLRRHYPPAYLKYRCIFIHIPKCAGNSILSSIDSAEAQRSHYSWHFYKLVDPIFFRDFFKFSVVRHPADRFASAFTFLKQGGKSSSDEWFRNRFIRDLDIEEFTHKLCKERLYRYRVMSYWHFRPQVHYICDKNGKVVVDKIIHIDNLSVELEPILRKLGVKNRIPWVNKSIRSSTETPDSVQRFVHQAYRQDFETLEFSNRI